MTRQVTPLVGRDADMSQLGAVLTRAGEGTGTLVLVSGEAGIGKTRLCAELARLQRQGGGRVLIGRSTPEEASIAYAALSDALRAARRAEPAVWEAARARAGVLWGVTPELAGKAGGQGRSADRPVVFEALLDAVDDAAGDSTTIWIVDDIHWADDSTWEFVKYAARRAGDLPLVLVVTYREEEIGPAHPWWPALVRLKREPNVLSLPLARLTAADSMRLIHAVAPALPEDAVTTIIERGAGTPLLVEELASLASGPGRLPAIPDIVRATVRERAGRLDLPGRALLEVAAVAGLEWDAELLASLMPSGRPGDLVAAGLLERDEERFRFRHPLLQEAAYQDVPQERRRALDERIAAAMSDHGGYPAERVAAHLERAGHLAASLSVLESAAREAGRSGQVGRAATLHTVAFRLAGRHRSLAGRRAGLEREAIGDLYRANHWSQLDSLVRAAWSRRASLPPAERAWLAAVFGAHLLWTGSTAEAFAVVRDELASIHGNLAALDEGVALLREAALIAWFNGDGVTARSVVDRALDVARRTDDVDLEVRARRVEIMIRHGEERDTRAAIARMRDNVATARARGLAVHEGWGLLYLSFLTRALQDVQAARQVSEQTGAWFWVATLHEASLHLMEGRRNVSEAIFAQIHREFMLGMPTITAWVDAKEACLYLHRGDLDEARQLLRGPSAPSDASSHGLVGAEWSAAQGWLAWEEGRFEEACAHLARAGSMRIMATYNTTSAGPAFIALRVDALLRLGRSDEAIAAISAAEAFNLGQDRFMAAALAAAWFRLELTQQRALAVESLTAAAPWPWLHALCRCWRAEFLRDTAAAEQARKQFGEIGAQLGVRRAEAVLRRLGVRLPGVQTDGYGPLSPREMEVAGLVAEGLSNPAIARRLYLSRPTVASHVAHILAKLGFSSRAQIAAWVAQRRALAP